jgi:hypothetical protein
MAVLPPVWHRARPPRSAQVARVAFACAALLLLARAVVPYSGELSNGFAAYYASAWLVAHGVDARDFYDDDWFRAQLPRAGITSVSDIYNVNPPTTSLLFLPLVPLSPRAADHVWVAVSLGLLVVALLLLWRTIAPLLALPPSSRAPAGLALAGLALVYSPVHFNLRQGQVYLLLLLLVVVALRAYVRGSERDERVLGLVLGLLLALKGAGILLWLAPVLDRRWRALAYGAGTAVTVALLAAPLLGLHAWRTYLARLPSLFDQPWTGVTAYQTLSSFVYHLTRAEPAFAPQPLVDAGWLARPLSSLLGGLVVVACVLAGWVVTRELDPARRRLLCFALLGVVAVPLQPVGEEHHYTLVLPSVWVALGTLSWTGLGCRGRAHLWLRLIPAVLGSLLLAAPIPFRSGALRDGWHALGAYPKLYGAALIALALASTLAAPPRAWPARIAARRAGVTRSVGRLRCMAWQGCRAVRRWTRPVAIDDVVMILARHGRDNPLLRCRSGRGILRRPRSSCRNPAAAHREDLVTVDCGAPVSRRSRRRCRASRAPASGVEAAVSGPGVR